MVKRALDEDLGEPLKFDPDFSGPLHNRSCTDVLCLGIFGVFVAAWVGVGLYALTNGDPSMLLIPRDSLGRRCGKESDVIDKPNLFFFDLTQCISPTTPFTGCPTTQVCVTTCPSRTYIKDVSGFDPLTTDEEEQYCSDGECPKWFVKSTPYLYRCLYNVGERKNLRNPKIPRTTEDEISFMKVQKRCIPNLNEINGTILESLETELDLTLTNLKTAVSNIKLLSQAEEVGQNVVEDIMLVWWKIVIGILIALVCCIIYIFILRWLATPIVWLSIFGGVVALGAAIYFTTIKYIEYRDKVEEAYEEDKSHLRTLRDLWLAGVIIFSFFGIVILLMLIFLRKRIVLAIALIKEGSKAVSSVTSALFFPILPWIFQLGIIAYAIAIGLFLTSTGTPLYKTRYVPTGCTQNPPIIDDVECEPKNFTVIDESCKNATCKFVKMENEALYPYLQAYNIFGFFWVEFFISAFGQMVLAAVFAQWYWTFKKRAVPFFAVTSAIMRTLRYHIGTLAFGSLIIAICRMIRVILEYIDHKVKKYDNELTKAILCCCKCFFFCLEKFLKFINKNAYIMTAIHGKNFCTSAKDAFLLLMRNILRVFVLDKVTDFLFFLSKLVLTIGVGAVCYVFFVTDLTPNLVDNSSLNYRIVPVVIIMICTYLVASLFFSVYSMAVDTLFLCFLEDCERNDGSAEKPYFMSRNLMKIFGKKNKFD